MLLRLLLFLRLTLLFLHCIFLKFCLLPGFFKFSHANLLLALPLATLITLGPISEFKTILSLSCLTSDPKIKHLSLLLPYFEFETAVLFRELPMT